jgi:hypothetical protein
LTLWRQPSISAMFTPGERLVCGAGNAQDMQKPCNPA